MSQLHESSYPGGGWHPPPGGWAPPVPPPPPPGRRRAAVVAWTVAGIVLSVVVLVAVVVAGFRTGRSVDEMGRAGAAPETTTPADPARLGDDPGLDSYAQRCHAGDMAACDDLAWLADVMSDYGNYGATCGGRIKAIEVLTCTTLD